MMHSQPSRPTHLAARESTYYGDLEKREGSETTGLDELAAYGPQERICAGRSQLEARHSQERKQGEQESTGLDELEATAPGRNSNDSNPSDQHHLEQILSDEQIPPSSPAEKTTDTQDDSFVRLTLMQLYVHSHLILFSILGVLARLGLVALTTYPGAPLATSVAWANVGGSMVMGFLSEDRMLYRRQWHKALEDTANANIDSDELSNDHSQKNKDASWEAFVTTRKSIHGFIGLTVGFCGTFTSFADVIRDAFFALANDLDTSDIANEMVDGALRSRNDGYSALAVVAVLWMEVSLSLAALQLGSHLALATKYLADRVPTSSRSLEPIINLLAVILGWGSWVGAIIMAVWPPHSAWRGQVIFAVIFAPLGAVLRFHLSKMLNTRVSSFPMGTFFANVFGTCVLGMVLVLQHMAPGQDIVSYQILQGIGDGFCGGLTTVSTWVLELTALRLRHSYVYAALSLAVSMACMTAIMGPVLWTAS